MPANPSVQRAASLEDVIFLFAPQRPLEDEYLHAFYVDRGSSARQDMATNLRVNDLTRGQPATMLLSGHAGSGKSTELNRLCEDLGSDFDIVFKLCACRLKASRQMECLPTG